MNLETQLSKDSAIDFTEGISNLVGLLGKKVLRDLTKVSTSKVVGNIQKL